MEGWADEILDGIEKVPILGSPGCVVVYGEKAQPILSNDKHEVLIAAASHGLGRVVVFSHNSYVTIEKFTKDEGDETILYQNVRKWVTKGRFSSETKVIDVTQLVRDEIPEDSLLIWRTGSFPCEGFMDKLLAHVEGGGGVVIGTTPWGFLQCCPQHTLETIPVNLFVQKLGMCFTSNYYGSRGELLVSENTAKDVHLLNALKDAADVGSFNTSSGTIRRNLTWLPKNEFCQIKEAAEGTITKFCEDIHCCPSPSKPATTSSEKALVTVMDRLFRDHAQHGGSVKIPSVEVFPGDLPADLPIECAEIHIENPQYGVRCFHPTGYYVPAGQELVIKLREGSSVRDGWSIAIGSHTDELFATEAPWRRWPTAQVRITLEQETAALRSHTGGLVYFISDKDTINSLNATIENVVQAPYFDINNPSLIDSWCERRQSPGLWADLIGNHFMLSVPASSVRELNDPEAVVNFWDSVIESHCSLAGVELAGRRPEWIVSDEQPRAGYMHAGYPVVTQLDVAQPSHEGTVDASLFNVERLYVKGSWGMFHELGHNLQDSMWTFEGTGEVTCNIFTLHAMDVLCGQKPWIHTWLQGNVPAGQNYLKNGAKFEEWQRSAGVALLIYAQLARDFGWKAYQEVFKQYRKLEHPEKPRGLQEQINQWISRFSNVVGSNLCPVFELWGFPISPKIQESLSHLPGHLPTDEMTSAVPERISKIMERYRISQ